MCSADRSSRVGLSGYSWLKFWISNADIGLCMEGWGCDVVFDIRRWCIRWGRNRGSCTLRIGRQIARRQARKRMLIATYGYVSALR